MTAALALIGLAFWLYQIATIGYAVWVDHQSYGPEPLSLFAVAVYALPFLGLALSALGLRARASRMGFALSVVSLMLALVYLIPALTGF